MIENSADFLPIWMLLSAGFGFLAGEAFGDSRRYRKCLEQARSERDIVHGQLKQQRGVINDIHKQIMAVTKGLEKRPH